MNILKNTEFEKLVKYVVKKTRKKQMTEEEYRYISTFLEDKNVLVFGSGFDSDLWRYSNKNGTIVFLEHNEKWITNFSDTYVVKYSTQRCEGLRLLEDYKNGITKEIEMDLPEVVKNTKWDIIIVDSPEGGLESQPGRMQSTYAAMKLATTETDIFIHDCDREIEDLYSKAMFSNLIKELTKLRHLRK